MDAADIETIRLTWLPVRQDPEGSAFSHDLDLERMRENKRLLKHAVKVIDTVSFVVDSLGGNEQTTGALNEALLALVKGHLKRQIGFDKFKNLGDVLIDFICIVYTDSIAPATKTTTEASTTTDPQTGAQTTTTVTITTTTTTTNGPATANDTQQRQTVELEKLKVSWAKLYGVILALVRQEEDVSAAAAATGTG